MPQTSPSVGFRIVDTRRQAGYLLDTGVLVAISDRRDQNFESGRECLRELSERGNPIYVSLPTIYETHNRILHSLGRDRARQFLQGIFDGATLIVGPDALDEPHAIEWIDRLQALKITLTDAVNMAIMVRLDLHAVVSFDSDFVMAGFRRVPPLAS